MGIFNWFKKKQPEVEAEKVKFDEIETWIKSKKSEGKIQEQDLLKQIKDKLEELTTDLNQKSEELEDFDMSKKKAEERAKLIIKENLGYYLNYLSKFLEELKQLGQEQLSLNSFIDKLNKAFFNFEKKAEPSFQKATYLIGELGKVKESIDNFFKFLKKLLKENDDFMKISKAANIIEEKLTEFKESEKSKRQIKNSVEELNEEIENFNAGLKKLNKIIDKIKNSEEYKQEISKKQKIENEKKDLEKQTLTLKQLIDFKELARIFHANENDMEVIKEFRDDFIKAFEKDNGKEIIDLINFLQKTEMDKQAISKKAEQIISKKQEINDSEADLELAQSTDILVKESEINDLLAKIQGLKNQQSKEQKRVEKFEEVLMEVKTLIHKEFDSINVELVP